MSGSARTAFLFFLAGGCCLIINLIAATDPGPGPDFLGAKKCRKCHIKEYKTWSDTKHAKAFEALTEKYHEDGECLKCHTTAMNEGGFKSMEETPDLLGIQCEQCHGAGGDHVPLMTKLKKEKKEKAGYPKDKKITATPTGCTGCHNPHVKHKKVD